MKQATMKLSNPMTNQPKVSCNSNKNNHKFPFSRRHGLVIQSFLLFALVIAILNHRYLSFIRKQDTVQSPSSSLSLLGTGTPPAFSPEAYPPFQSQLWTNVNLVQRWQKWAEKPILGTYLYPSSSTSRERYSSIIHFPTMDLETVLATTNTPSLRRAASVKQQSPSTTTTDSTPLIVLTRMGNKYATEEMDAQRHPRLLRQPNQDRIVMLSRLVPSTQDNMRRYPVESDFWMGLFDGHGNNGECISQFCSLELAKRIQLEWDKESSNDRHNRKPPQDEVKETLKIMFEEINESVPSLFASGSTGISVWRRDHLLYISNVGDSLAFVASYEKQQHFAASRRPKIEIVYSTKPHKPDTPEERDRIEAAGGTVEEAPFEGASARLFVPVPNSIDVFALAMSRSFGDHDGKSQGLIAEPTTDVLDLTKLDAVHKEYMVVCVTDGLVDHERLTTVEVAESMAKAFLTESQNKNAPEEAAKQLIVKASEMWAADPIGGGYRDDESIAVRKLKL